MEEILLNKLFVFRLLKQELRQEKYMYLFWTNFVLDLINIPIRKKQKINDE